MTIKEFSMKYNVPYNVVYEASYQCEQYSPGRRDKEYKEHDLFEAVREAIQRRKKKYHKALDYVILMEENLAGVW